MFPQGTCGRTPSTIMQTMARQSVGRIRHRAPEDRQARHCRSEVQLRHTVRKLLLCGQLEQLPHAPPCRTHQEIVLGCAAAGDKTLPCTPDVFVSEPCLLTLPGPYCSHSIASGNLREVARGIARDAVDNCIRVCMRYGVRGTPVTVQAGLMPGAFAWRRPAVLRCTSCRQAQSQSSSATSSPSAAQATPWYSTACHQQDSTVWVKHQVSKPLVWRAPLRCSGSTTRRRPSE